MELDVVICVRNQGKVLDRLMRQLPRYVPFKNLIVVYGDSADDTKSIAEKYTSLVFWDGNKGLGAARKLGMAKATSEIVAMIDSDVILGKGWYNQLISQFNNPKTAAAMGTCVYGYGCKPLEAYWEYLRRIGENNYGCHNTMFRREVILQVGNFKDTIKGAGEDYDLYLRLLNAGYDWVWVRAASAYHPMRLGDYYKHLRWWAQGGPYMDEIVRQVRATSILKWYKRQVANLLTAVWVGLKLSVSVEPSLGIYYPAMIATSAYAHMTGLKKLCLSGPAKQEPTG